MPYASFCDEAVALVVAEQAGEAGPDFATDLGFAGAPGTALGPTQQAKAEAVSLVRREDPQARDV